MYNNTLNVCLGFLLPCKRISSSRLPRLPAKTSPSTDFYWPGRGEADSNPNFEANQQVKSY